MESIHRRNFREKYVEKIKSRGKLAFENIDILDPQKLLLNQTCYSFFQTPEGLFVLKGGEDYSMNDNLAKEIERDHLVKKYQELKDNPNNLDLLMDYSIELFGNGYNDLSELVLGKALMIYELPKIYHLLARLHLDSSEQYRLSGKKLYEKKHALLADIIAERGLEYVDRDSIGLVEDVINAALRTGNTEKENKFYQKINFNFSTMYSK